MTYLVMPSFVPCQTVDGGDKSKIGNLGVSFY